MRSLRGSNATAVIARLNPIIRGWAAYYRGVVSSKTFTALDNYAVVAHLPVGPPQPPQQVEEVDRAPLLRQVQQVQERPVGVRRPRARVNDRGDVAHLVKFSWTNIVRHQLVTGGASPDDPDLTDYWAARRRKIKPPLDSYNLRLLARQDGRCPLCGDHLLTADQPPQSPTNGNAGG